ncbi:prefoldin domain-containing protein [Mucilaginibacter boryungensis]|uniref:Uncharacterized protein n=1 Tax=Mucilaginibacter boryungensis TaxID=768480 RepID=A0ABR9XMM1_9SPHI|nr:hypothetical protein [Mucilaginibacter boryungensis]MBE9668260.1 hypothetical protein [Mucilaginibacter boryungensis]
MKKTFLFGALLCLCLFAYADTGSFSVGGDFNKFYPVTIVDGGWPNNAASEIELGRSNVHEDSNWRGSLMAKFTYHVTNWGHGANFIDADINAGTAEFIAGWIDGTYGNANQNIIVWLRGGGTTYHFKSNYTTYVTVYDGVQHALPYQTSYGTYDSKTTRDYYVNPFGMSYGGNIYINGPGENYFSGGVAIGQYDTEGYALNVNGNIHTKEVNVNLSNWHYPDYVFKPTYRLPTLKEVDSYIAANHHLPDVPTEQQVMKNGLNLGEMNQALLKKVEELTLYLIEKDKEIDDLKQQKSVSQTQQNQIDELRKQVETLLKKKS